MCNLQGGIQKHATKYAEVGSLLVSQRNQRIESHSAPRGNEAGRQRNGPEQEYDDRESQAVVCRDAEE